MVAHIRSLIAAGAIFAFLGLGLPAEAKVGQVRTWLGHVYAGDGGDGRLAYLDGPGGFAADASCHLFIADTLNNVVRRLDGFVNAMSTVAGSTQYGTADGPARQATFRNPADVALGASGEVYIADTGNSRIRLLQDGLVSTLLTGMGRPTGLTLDGQTLYISQTALNKIVAYNVITQTVTPIASISSPSKLVVLNGFLYVIQGNGTALSRISLSDNTITDLTYYLVEAEGLIAHNDLIYYVTGTNGTTNQITTYNPSTGVTTLLQNTLETEWYNHPSDIDFCGSSMRLLFRMGSSIYSADESGGNPVQLAGEHRWGDRNGSRSAALLGRPLSLARYKTNLYILENHKVKAYDLVNNQLRFLVGHANDNFLDGVGSNSRLSGAVQMVLSPDGKKLYIADRNNNRIRHLDIASTTLSTLTGAGKINMFNNDKNAYAEGTACTTFDLGVAGCAYFNRPTGIAISKDGKTLYVADSFNAKVRSIEVATGKTKLLAGSTPGWLDGVGSAAKFRRPNNLLVSRDGKKLYVLDLTNHLLRQIDLATRRVTTLAGTGKAGYRNGPFRQAVFSYPDSLALGPGNSLFLSEVGSQRIRVIDIDKKEVRFLAGSGQRGLRNGDATVAEFNNPRGMLMLSDTHLLVTDEWNDLIRVVNHR